MILPIFHSEYLTLKLTENDDRSIILRDLTSEGLAEEVQSLNFRIDYSEWYQIDNEIRSLLEFYSEYPFTIEFDSEGVIGTVNGKYKVIFREYPTYGNILHFESIGPFLIDSNKTIYQISNESYKILAHLNNFTFKSRNQALKHLGIFQSLVSKTDLKISNKLSSRQVIVPNKLNISPKLSSDLLELTAEIKYVNPEELNRRFRDSNCRDRVEVKNTDGKRASVLFSNEQIDELKNIDNFNRFNVEKKLEVLQNPTSLFDPELVDLDNFSKRVVEIGFYKPKVSPFISPYKSVWIPGFEIKSNTGDGTRRIKLKDQETLNNFICCYQEAKKSHKITVRYDGAEVSLKDAEIIIEVAKKQINNPNIPLKNSSKGNVLIIKENDDLLEFWSEQISNVEIKHSFRPIHNLKKHVTLKAHQKEGIAWIQALIEGNFRGALLADDMGLGKTIQVLSIIDWYYHSIDASKPTLITAPVSLLENWSCEYEKFFNKSPINLEVLHGGIPKVYDEHVVGLLQKSNTIYLTNYETIRNSQLNFGAVDFALVVLDEAQKIKTPGTLVTNAIKALKSEFNLAMTGTPVENSFLDIWCIMDFCVPGLLSDAKSFAAKYQTPLNNPKTNIKELGQTLRKEIGVFIKRRLKADVANDLPEKTIISYQEPMPKKQEAKYLEVINSYRLGIEEHMLVVLQRLKLVSDHPFLIDQNINHYDAEELVRSSAKLKKTTQILKNIERNGEKVIIFAERRETQRLLQRVIKDLFGFHPNVINGDTASSQKTIGRGQKSRQQIINQFHSVNGYNVIIMSPIAAGIGLNVTGANHVIHYSRHWNPARESQATDRAYRIGQIRNVYVHYPMSVFNTGFTYQGVTMESFDEKISKLLENKSELANQSLFPTERVEVSQSEAFQALLGNLILDENFTDSVDLESVTPLTFKEFCSLKPQLFEAAVGSLYKSRGFEVHLTPVEGDRGADIIAIGDSEAFVILVKSSRNKIDSSCIREIKSALEVYQKKYTPTLKPVIITNSLFIQSTRTLAQNNNVLLIDQLDLNRMYTNKSVNSYEINTLESFRLKTI